MTTFVGIVYTGSYADKEVEIAYAGNDYELACEKAIEMAKEKSEVECAVVQKWENGINLSIEEVYR